MIGEVVLNDIDADNKSANFRIAIYHPNNFGKGFGTEATKEVLNYTFNNIDINRIELEVYQFNKRAINSYLKSGFIIEGTKREVHLWEGKYHNSIIMSILKSDFQK